jgi:hypothetical protein
MTIARLQDLESALREQGWEIANPNEKYAIEDELIFWNLVNQNTFQWLTLEFYVIGDLGQRSFDLRDIFYCRVPDSGPKLLFDKRTSPTWKSELEKFVAEISQL